MKHKFSDHKFSDPKTNDQIRTIGISVVAVVAVHLFNWTYFQKKKKNTFWRDVQSPFTLPSVSFSPESGGRVNPRRAMEEMSTQGTIRLKK